MSFVNLNSLDNAFSAIETGEKGCCGFNTAGYIPVVSTFTGSLRITYAKIQTIVACALAILLVTQSCLQDDQKQAAKLRQDAVHALYYSAHALTNLFRGIIEMIPLASLVTCLPYDKCFQIRYRYENEAAVAKTA